jgi:hypothetical protein
LIVSIKLNIAQQVPEAIYLSVRIIASFLCVGQRIFPGTRKYSWDFLSAGATNQGEIDFRLRTPVFANYAHAGFELGVNNAQNRVL